MATWNRNSGVCRKIIEMPWSYIRFTRWAIISDRYEHLVRYVGWYSNRVRGERARIVSPPAGVALLSPGEEPGTEFAARAKAAWARLIRKVYEADPLECPQCQRPMRVIALIENPGVI